MGPEQIIDRTGAARVYDTILNDQDMLLKLTSERIKAEHTELRDYDVYGFVKRLIKEDKDAQTLRADIMRR